MSWVKIDDGIGDNLKTLKVWAQDPAAFALDVRAIAYSAKHLTDGFVPDEILDLWYAGREDDRKRLVGILVDVGRWTSTEDGFDIHDFLDYNKSREEVEEERRKRAVNGKAGGRASGKARRETKREIRESLDEAT